MMKPPERGRRGRRTARAVEARRGRTRTARSRPDGGHGTEDTRARDAWAEALPELRAEWERHEQRFPERTRAAPGCPSRRRLAGRREPEAHPGAERGRRARPARTSAPRAGRSSCPRCERVEAADPDRRLAGLEHMLKGEDRLKEKIADETAATTRTDGPSKRWKTVARCRAIHARLRLGNATLKEFSPMSIGLRRKDSS